MSILISPESNNFNAGPLAPSGIHLAVCIAVIEQENVERRKYDNPQETLDLVRLVFGLRDQNGQRYKLRTWDMRISSSSKSKLWAFLSSWLGRPPEYGWDFCEMKGHGAMITVEQKTNRDRSKTFANVAGVAPVLGEVRANVPSMEDFGPDEGCTTSLAPPQPPTGKGRPPISSVGPDDDLIF